MFFNGKFLLYVLEKFEVRGKKKKMLSISKSWFRLYMLFVMYYDVLIYIFLTKYLRCLIW